jgi:hypothetical protein
MIELLVIDFLGLSLGFRNDFTLQKQDRLEHVAPSPDLDSSLRGSYLSQSKERMGLEMSAKLISHALVFHIPNHLPWTDIVVNILLLLVGCLGSKRVSVNVVMGEF